jgi:AcrR family transcriptional regulator
MTPKAGKTGKSPVSKSKGASKVLWTRAEKQRRAPPTREAIVEVAISLADSDGLEAVSIRQIAVRLQARPMSIYSYARVETKEELFDLMIDEVSAEMLLPKARAKSWQKSMREIAILSRGVLILHPWWIELVGRRVMLGPNALRYREQSLAALAELRVSAERRMAIVTALEAYTVGQASIAIDRSGLLKKADPGSEKWRADIESYQRSLVATGDFPNIAKAGTTKRPSPEELERAFLFGLDCLLDGITTFLEAAKNAAKG